MFIGRIGRRRARSINVAVEVKLVSVIRGDTHGEIAAPKTLPEVGVAVAAVVARALRHQIQEARKSVFGGVGAAAVAGAGVLAAKGGARRP